MLYKYQHVFFNKSTKPQKTFLTLFLYIFIVLYYILYL